MSWNTLVRHQSRKREIGERTVPRSAGRDRREDAPSPRVREIFRRVVEYVSASPDVSQYFPQVVAKAIHDTRAAAMLGLYMLQQQGAATLHYGLYCSIHSTELERDPDIPSIDKGFCDSCGEEKTGDDDSAYGETYFTVDREALKRISGRSAPV